MSQRTHAHAAVANTTEQEYSINSKYATQLGVSEDPQFKNKASRASGHHDLSAAVSEDIVNSVLQAFRQNLQRRIAERSRTEELLQQLQLFPRKLSFSCQNTCSLQAKEQTKPQLHYGAASQTAARCCSPPEEVEDFAPVYFLQRNDPNSNPEGHSTIRDDGAEDNNPS